MNSIPTVNEAKQEKTKMFMEWNLPRRTMEYNLSDEMLMECITYLYTISRYFGIFKKLSMGKNWMRPILYWNSKQGFGMKFILWIGYRRCGNSLDDVEINWKNKDILFFFIDIDIFILNILASIMEFVRVASIIVIGRVDHYNLSTILLSRTEQLLFPNTLIV